MATFICATEQDASMRNLPAPVGKAYADGQAPGQTRLLVVDFARVLAILFMIQGHGLDVLLAPQYRQGAVFESWLFLRGLTAPMFFTLSGVSFTLSSLKHWDSYVRPTSRLFRRLRRFGFFVLLGYALHFPVKSFHDFRYLDAAGWQGWLQVDVLQCVGLTLLFLQILVWVSGTPERFAKLAAGASALMVLFAPVAWGLPWTKFLPVGLASYLTAQTGSLFPLLPWSGYVLFGSALGYVIVRLEWNSGSLARKPWLIGAASLVLAGVCVALFPLHPYGNINFWTISPGVFLVKSGSVLVLLALLSWVTRRIAIPQQITRSIAQESLVVYFVHVCILYGCIWHDGLRQMVGAHLTVLPTLAWIGVLLISMLLLAWTWSWYKRTEPRFSLLARTAVIVLAIAYGLT
jgi:uncharacterized membrane protein